MPHVAHLTDNHTTRHLSVIGYGSPFILGGTCGGGSLARTKRQFMYRPPIYLSVTVSLQRYWVFVKGVDAVRCYNSKASSTNLIWTSPMETALRDDDKRVLLDRGRPAHAACLGDQVAKRVVGHKVLV